MDKEILKELLKELFKSGEIKFEEKYFEWTGETAKYVIIDNEKIEL